MGVGDLIKAFFEGFELGRGEGTALTNATRSGEIYEAPSSDDLWHHSEAKANANALAPLPAVAAEAVAEFVVTGEMQDAFDNALPRREDARRPNDRDKPLYNALADGDVFTKAFRAALALASPPLRGEREAIARTLYEIQPIADRSGSDGQPITWDALASFCKELHYEQADAILSLQSGASEEER